MNAYTAMVLNNAILITLIIAAIVLTHSAWPMWGLLFMTYQKGSN